MSPAAAGTRIWPVRYRDWKGKAADAVVVTPDDVGPRHAPELPLVICPHGRGVHPRDVPPMWGDLPARHRFAVVCPDARGRRLKGISWGWHRQIDDLQRMPHVVRETLPWFRLRPRHVYCVGGSMGGHETLLLLARRPDWLRGAAAYDAPCDMTLRYRDFAKLGRVKGPFVQLQARIEFGGTPRQVPREYESRSPLSHARQIAGAWIRLHVAWSPNDHRVINGRLHSHLLVERVKQLEPQAPVTEQIGDWEHSKEMRSELPHAIELLGIASL